MLNVPGQKMPTEKPHRPTPIRPVSGLCVRPMSRYAATHRPQQPSMVLVKSILSPRLPYIRRLRPISRENTVGPVRSPSALLTPSPFSAKVEAHWLTACSLAPAQTIISMMTQNMPERNSSPTDIPFSPSSTSGARGTFRKKMPFVTGSRRKAIRFPRGISAQSRAITFQLSTPNRVKNAVDRSTTPTCPQQ